MMTKIRKALKGEGGFTLIELMVVVLIIGILVAIAIPSFNGMRNRGYRAQATSNLRNGVTAASTYATDNQGAYTGMDAAALGGIEPNVPFADAGAAINTVVISGVAADAYTLTVTDQAGAVYTAVKAAGSGVVYTGF